MQKNRQCRREWGFAMDFAAADSALPANKGLRQKYTLPAAHKVFFKCSRAGGQCYPRCSYCSETDFAQ